MTERDRVKIEGGFVDALIRFRNSKYFSSNKNYMYSTYWKEHRQYLKFIVEEEGVLISGKSGVYIPQRYDYKILIVRISSLLSRSFKNPLYYIRKIIGVLNLRFLLRIPYTYKNAFSKLIRSDGDVQSSLQVNHALLRSQPGCFLGTKDIDRHHYSNTGRVSNDHTYLVYYFYNILNSYVPRGVLDNIIEIGAGNGNLAVLLIEKFRPKFYFIVDLPEIILNCAAYIKECHPGVGITLPDEELQVDSQYELGHVVFLTPLQLDNCPASFFDLLINTHSFQEMSNQQLEEYFTRLPNLLADTSYFFSVNRVEKYSNIEIDGARSLVNPYRFSSWNLCANNMESSELIEEVSRFHSLVNTDPVMLSLRCYVRSPDNLRP